MGKIDINLLPVEIAATSKQDIRKVWIIKLSSLLIAFIVIVTAIALGLGIFQTNQDKQLTNELDATRSKITSLNTQEGYLTLIKQRLVRISQLQSEDAKRTAALYIITNLIPSGVKFSDLAVDQKNIISLSAQAADVESLKTFLAGLSDDKSDNQIKKADIQSISKGGNNEFKVDLSAETK